ncbi:MAG: hypothetical protein OXG11_07945, partial [Chloroflexi bacterium]|nr:hypothetical protein [Chloroflexota bacterium]
MTYKPGPCPIWGEPFLADIMPTADHLLRVRSPRAGGDYSVSQRTHVTHLAQLNTEEKARLTTWLIDQRSRGVDCPKVTAEIVEYVRRKSPLPAHERAVRLLRFTATKSESIGTYASIGVDDPGVLTWSESSTPDEADYLVDYLRAMGWIEGTWVATGGGKFRVTVDGYFQIAEQAKNLDSSKVFVAMWFDDSMDRIYEAGFKPAIKDAGYKPLRIDRKPDLNNIHVEIIAEIRRSKFVVADFTHKKDS